jgi:pyridoxal phosphate enzyme (YggS family)
MTDKYTLEQVKQNIEIVRSNINKACFESNRSPDDVTLLAATKTVCPEIINFAICNGINCIGENRVQELLEKYDSIDRANTDIHFIGHLQTNKVKYIADKVSMIHSVDSEKLAAEIDRQSYKHGKRMDVLVEVNVGNELSKGGVSPEECLDFVERISHMENIRICGLMTIPPKIDFE